MAGAQTIRSGARWLAMAASLALMALAIAGLQSELASGSSAHLRRAQAVDIRNFAFHPQTLTVGVGTRVEFTNSSNVTHTATRGGAFNTGNIRPGKTIGVRFSKKGSFAYHCSIHPFMHGTVIVK